MPKSRLLTPGPTELPEPALLAMARQLRHHRTAEFREVLAGVFADLQYVCQTQNPVFLLSSSGTGAMEAAVANIIAPGSKAIVLESGKFSERWRELCQRFGGEVVSYAVPWGQPFDPAEVARLLAEHPDAVAVFTTLMETSTGVEHDIEAIGRIVGPSSALLVVDGISGVGACRCLADTWNIDMLVVGGQKALMAPPGVAAISVSPAAWRRIESIERRAFYFDLLAYRKAREKSDTPYTPPIPLVHAAAESLRRIRQETVEAAWSRAERLARATRAGVAAAGLAVYAARPAAGMTAVATPPGLDADAVARRLMSRFGVKVAGGQGEAKGRVFRIAHMGTTDEVDILGALAALELVLVEMQQTVKLGSAVAAASTVFAQPAG